VEDQPQDKKQSSIFYKNTSEKISLASRVSYLTRKKIYLKFIELMKPTETTTVLDVGVTCDNIHSESNFFENFYTYKRQITCVGVEDGSYLEKKYPGLRFVPVYTGQPLPFGNKQFDIVFSNATVEHTGSTSDQTYFISELVRVAKSFFIVTPNRWFPVEMHTTIPLIHYFPKSFYRFIYKHIDLNYWAHEKNLNLLDGKSFLRVFPSSAKIEFFGIYTSIFVSNLIAYGWNDRSVGDV